MPRLLLVLSCLSLTAASPAAPTVATRMRHVVFHLGDGIALRVDDLAGHLVSRTAAPVLFDDVDAYLVDIQSARVAMSADSLTNLMNDYVFASPDAPLKNIKIAIDGQEITQSGTLRKAVPLPFTIRATLSATADGKIRLHPTALKAAGFVSKRVLDFFGLDLEKLVKMKHVTGVTVDGDDLLLDPQSLLPPPRIRGRLTYAGIENGFVVQQFGPRVPPRAIAPADKKFTNYMYYRGGTLRFGKLTMRDADLLLVDSDPKDAFDFSPAKYNDQLVAGYSKNTRTHGLIVYMPDLADLVQRSTPQAPAAETRDASKRQP